MKTLKWIVLLLCSGVLLCNAQGIRPIETKELPPVIGAWFWSNAELEPDGYKAFLDNAAAHTPYTLLSTACRRIEVVDPKMHDQVAKAVKYANSLGLKIALETDIRLARQAFRAEYPDELQEELVLKTVTFENNAPANVVFTGTDTRDHMNGSLPKYMCLTTRLVRVYSYIQTQEGIDPSTVRDITNKGVVATPEGPRKLTVKVPAQQGRAVCVIASHTMLTPDVFAPHLLEFQRKIIKQYADIPLSGVMKDEWGFPPDHSGNPKHNRYWFSSAMAKSYAQVSGGRDLIRDSLLMCVGEKGGKRERNTAINRYGKMCRDRNVEIETDFYRAGKEVFGKDAFIVTHATWTPYPGAQEFRKNGLSWWDATRDIGQTDESTPYPCRTSIAKRWGYPLWYNQYYSKKVEPYIGELWSDALSGGRLNVHPLYPRPDLVRAEISNMLMRSKLMAGMTRLRILDFISQAPLDCPVAVVFGHASAMNWTQPSYNNVGLGLASKLCAKGYPADLVPSSLIESKALTIDAEGYVRLGPQRYQAVVLFQPEFCGISERIFFHRAAMGKSALFQVGEWNCDAEGRSLDAKEKWPSENVILCTDEGACITEVLKLLEKRKVGQITPWTQKADRWGHKGGALAKPATDGYASLTDGTYLRIAGTKNPEGDPIKESFQWQGHTVSIDAIGVVAIRFSDDGKIAAFTAGGLKSVATDNLNLTLPKRIDIAFKVDSNGHTKGMVQGLDAEEPIPSSLNAICKEWLRLAIPSL